MQIKEEWNTHPEHGRGNIIISEVKKKKKISFLSLTPLKGICRGCSIQKRHPILSMQALNLHSHGKESDLLKISVEECQGRQADWDEQNLWWKADKSSQWGVFCALVLGELPGSFSPVSALRALKEGQAPGEFLCLPLPEDASAAPAFKPTSSCLPASGWFQEPTVFFWQGTTVGSP